MYTVKFLSEKLTSVQYKSTLTLCGCPEHEHIEGFHVQLLWSGICNVTNTLLTMPKTRLVKNTLLNFVYI